jgi:hypothetical protein
VRRERLVPEARLDEVLDLASGFSTLTLKPLLSRRDRYASRNPCLISGFCLMQIYLSPRSPSATGRTSCTIEHAVRKRASVSRATVLM